MSSLSNPYISVVIPTRERADTLAATLRTCLDQDYANCEIVVSDNFSHDGTKGLVSSARDSRIRYVNPGQRLSMSHNWEFALSHARGDYVTYVGDDDGLVPGALSKLAEIIERSRTMAISWAFGSYFWPNCVHSPAKNLLFVPTSHGLERRSAPKMLREVLSFRRSYTDLPYVYKGLVSRELIDRVKSASGGSFFHSMIPDVYSAVALSLFAVDYLYSHFPYSVNGTSGSSNGAAQLDPKLPAAREFMAESNIPFHPDLVLAPTTPILLAETFLQARDHIQIDHDFKVDLQAMLRAAMKDVATTPPERYTQVRDAVLAISNKHGLTSGVKKMLSDYPNRPRTTFIGLTQGFNIANRTHIVDCAKLGIHNIHQAATLCAVVTGARKLGLMRNPVATTRTTATLSRGILARNFRRWIGRGS